VTAFQPALILIRGIPGSGKSTLAATLKDLLSPLAVEVLDPDHVDQFSLEFLTLTDELTMNGVPSQIHVYRYLCVQAQQALSNGAVVIWNQPFTDREIFKSLVRLSMTFPTRPHILIVELDVPAEVAYRRVRARTELGGHGPSSRTFGRFVAEFETFSDLGYPTIQLEQEWINDVRSCGAMRKRRLEFGSSRIATSGRLHEDKLVAASLVTLLGRSEIQREDQRFDQRAFNS
jgi:predicted kinase